MVSEGLGMIFEGLLKLCIWLVVLLAEVVLVGVAVYFAIRGLVSLGIVVADRYF